MSNMSYCKFENTAKDLKDCLEDLEILCCEEDIIEFINGLSSIHEKKGFLSLIKHCIKISSYFSDMELNKIEEKCLEN